MAFKRILFPMFDCRFYDTPVAHVDTVCFHAFWSMRGRVLPINRDFKKFRSLFVARKYTFKIEGEEIEGKIYALRDDHKIGILEGVRFVAGRNHFSIVINNLNWEYKKSLYRILIEVLFELHKMGIVRIRRWKNKKSLFTRLYFIARNFFTVSKIDFRFDWNREQGIPILEKCRNSVMRRNKNYPPNFNTVYLTSKKSRKYVVKIYDKRKNFKGIGYFPIRLEVSIMGAFKPQDLKGTSKQLFMRYDLNLQYILYPLTEYPIIRDFLDCIYWEDQIFGYSRKEIYSASVSQNQYIPAVV